MEKQTDKKSCSFQLPVDTMRLFKAKTALLGVTQTEYLTQLIIRDLEPNMEKTDDN